MLTNKIPAVLIAVSFALAVAPLDGADAAARATYDITFDDHCYGLHMEFSKYLVAGSVTGCLDGYLVRGVAQPNKTGRYGVTKGSEYLLTDMPPTIHQRDSSL